MAASDTIYQIIRIADGTCVGTAVGLPQAEHARRRIAGIRALAYRIEEHPHFTEETRSSLSSLASRAWV